MFKENGLEPGTARSLTQPLPDCLFSYCIKFFSRTTFYTVNRQVQWHKVGAFDNCVLIDRH